MGSDFFINKLVSDLSPRSVMTVRRLWLCGSICFVAALLLIFITLGIRPDYLEDFKSASLVWKPGIFILSSISTVWILAVSSLPGRSMKNYYLVPIILSSAVLLYLLTNMLILFDTKEMTSAMTDERAPWCLGVVTLVGGLILFVVWHIWLKNSAPESTGYAGFIAGMCSGFIAASAYAFHCDQDHPLYVITYYGLPIALLSVTGGYLAKRHLKW